MIALFPIPAFNDNYIWAIIQPKTHEAIIVDPGDATPVLQFLQERDLTLTAILITHHHRDHTGGIDKLSQHTQVPVYSYEKATIPGSNKLVTEHQTLSFFNDELTLSVILTPGHTLDHITYYGNDCLLCGDTLFSAGCGRLFEGTPKQMYHSIQTLMQLPSHTRIYCTHEYTLANLAFAHTVEPNNSAIAERIREVEQLRVQNIPSLPSTIQQEQATNPFCRTDAADVIEAAEAYAQKKLTSPIDVFAALRQWKDNF